MALIELADEEGDLFIARGTGGTGKGSGFSGASATGDFADWGI